MNFNYSSRFKLDVRIQRRKWQELIAAEINHQH